MKKMFLSGLVLSALLFTTSCNQKQESEKQQKEMEQEEDPFEHTPALPEQQQLDSITGDSVDHHSPESPRI